MELIDGNKIAADIIAELKTQVAALPGRPPCLALVRVGEDPASVSYVKKKETASATIGITSRLIFPPVTISQDELFALIDGVVKFERTKNDRKKVSVYPGISSDQSAPSASV